MGRFENFLHAFVSPSIVSFWRKTVKGETSFRPYRQMWKAPSSYKPPPPDAPPSVKNGGGTWMDYSFPEELSKTPIEARTECNSGAIRLAFCAMLVFAIIFGDFAVRFAAICVVAGVVAMPVEMIGHFRYVLWWPCALTLCAIDSILIRWGQKMPKICLFAFGGGICAVLAALSARQILVTALAIDQKKAYFSYFAANPEAELFSMRKANGFERPHDLASLTLRRRLVPALAETKIIEDAPRNCRYQVLYDVSCLVRAETSPLSHLAIAEIYAVGNRKERLARYIGYIAKMFLVQAPANIADALRSMFCDT